MLANSRLIHFVFALLLMVLQSCNSIPSNNNFLPIIPGNNNSLLNQSNNIATTMDYLGNPFPSEIFNQLNGLSQNSGTNTDSIIQTLLDLFVVKAFWTHLRLS